MRATMKAYTDLSQSKKLAEFLPLESADMVLLHEEPYETSDSKFDGLHQALCVPFNKYDRSWRQKYRNISYFPCWSLSALLNVLPKIVNNETLFIETSPALWHIGYRNAYIARTVNLVDACYKLILKLHEMNLL